MSLSELHADIARQNAPEPVVTLELFFDGNDDPASIGCNLPDHPGPSPADVGAWAAELGPEAPGDAWWYGVPPLRVDVQPPARLVTLWWD